MIYNRETVKAWAGDSQWRALRADLARFQDHGFTGWGSEGLWALALYRMQRIVNELRPRWLWMPVRLFLAVVKKLFTMFITVDLHPHAQIGPGLFIPHGGQIRVHADAKIGADCAIHHICTIGAGPQPGAATIGDHVTMSCHTCIIGPVSIGDDAIIAAGSLVISDVPAGATVLGVPARVMPGFKPRAVA